jgi:hypothetical protein
VAKKAAMKDVGDKENFMPATPKKMITSSTYQTTGGLPSPLSPSKRAINVDALESPTKRLQISQESVKAIPPPNMNWSVAKRTK